MALCNHLTSSTVCAKIVIEVDTKPTPSRYKVKVVGLHAPADASFTVYTPKPAGVDAAWKLEHTSTSTGAGTVTTGWQDWPNAGGTANIGIRYKDVDDPTTCKITIEEDPGYTPVCDPDF